MPYKYKNIELLRIININQNVLESIKNKICKEDTCVSIIRFCSPRWQCRHFHIIS